MGYTNKTSHYDLPQWIAGDKPSWLGDVNTAMLNIDTAIAGADASATAAESSAAAANAQVQAQEAKITKNTTDIQALTEQLADVSGVANAALPKNGGTMTGNLILNAEPTSDLQAATKKYVDDNSSIKDTFTKGENFTGNLVAVIIGKVFVINGYGKTTSGMRICTAQGNPLNLSNDSAVVFGNAVATTGGDVGGATGVLNATYISSANLTAITYGGGAASAENNAINGLYLVN